MIGQFLAEIEAFIRTYVKDIEDGVTAVFAGAGLPKNCGFVNWSKLLSEITEELGLKVELEHNLISVAQYHINKKNSSNGLTWKILEEFSDQAKLSDAHNIISRLPIRTYWTTNYDTLIEDSLKNNYRVEVGYPDKTRQPRFKRPSLNLDIAWQIQRGPDSQVASDDAGGYRTSRCIT
ncbi:hypothetical protein [Azorhizophilus paspali]|uniref:SIR2-like domain-containing protein n=2 Tax=Azorhizophilus paspali TaxID=69963 RepID=A0ABV6SJ25_AZOPA